MAKNGHSRVMPDQTVPTMRPAFAPWLSRSNDVTSVFLAAGQVPDLVNLAGGLPEPSVWPVAELADLAAEAIRNHPDETLGYGPIPGLPALRDLIAARFSTEALRLSRENVLITTGGMQALELMGKVLLEPGGTVAAQSPAYLGALDAWMPHAPRYRPMRIEGNDFDPHAALAGAQFAYTVPNFSNPSGRLVALPERQALVAAAHATGTWLIEDDPYGALYYEGEPLPRLLELSAAERPGPYGGPVVYMGSLSKELAPGLRIGWVIAAPEMIVALATAKQGSDMCTSGLSQMLALRALQAGITDRIRPEVLAIYRARRDALCAALQAHLAGELDWQVPVGGMFVWATARDPRLDTDRLLHHAMAEGVCISPSSVFDPEGLDRRSLRLNFTLNPPERLEEGCRRLARAIRAALAEAG
ncbi:PLP-dependent aminotransferase family protein [Paracoccus pantotrophus]|uniref:PLP-dependent aminotransferase family protein n=1 Tax=Paracoccus pantotrophus TaxID=82367 RepID=A0A7H9BS54_PARPN|nr:PLP-dependent aminotransferase family protein [Paracoccus pantotrophus]QLH14197.1 PLP-dependent aminotransferase family protein [Paracoccus pantotrophus]RDD99272.1 PLP-dependent aminotransferase family protein [Paracoccus pantotrophus]RNI16897.1 PLP-dependent aminotransferase family protein [Paracoccus pantotrophus]WGR67729.1 PLP-dependent aminotransferase family protein [Paracoccus pantotrophus]